MIGNGHAMRVPAEVAEERLDPADRRLRVHHPRARVELVDESLERRWLGERGGAVLEDEPACTVEPAQSVEEFPPEQRPEDLERQQVALARANPSAVCSEPAAGHDAVEVRVGAEEHQARFAPASERLIMCVL